MKNMMLLLSFITLSAPVFADERLDNDIARIQHDWAKANYQTPKDGQESATILCHLQTLRLDQSGNQGIIVGWRCLRQSTC